MPLYHQIYLALKQQILSGELTNGERLPSEADLAKSHKVSRITAKRAMNELANENLVSRSRGKGTTVSFTAPRAEISADFGSLKKNLIAIGTSTKVEVLSFTYLNAPPPIAEALHLEPGMLVQKTERRRTRQGKPFSYTLSYLPEEIGKTFGQNDLTTTTILDLIEKTGHLMHEARQSITAILANPKIAAALEVQQGTPLLKISRLVFDQKKYPIQYIEVVHRPDMHQLTMNLQRTDLHGSDTQQWRSEAADLPD